MVINAILTFGQISIVTGRIWWLHDNVWYGDIIKLD